MIDYLFISICMNFLKYIHYICIIYCTRNNWVMKDISLSQSWDEQ